MPINFDKAIAVLNAADVPMEKTHFYRYLKLGGYRDHSLVAKANYLSSLGFIKGTDKVQERTLQCLGYILDHYYYNEVRAK